MVKDDSNILKTLESHLKPQAIAIKAALLSVWSKGVKEL